MLAARPATPADDAVVAELRELARAEMVPVRGAEQFLRAEGVAERDDAVVVVGTIDDAVVGFGAFVVDGDRALLAELFTHPRARGVGVGHAVLSEVRRLARGRGCVELDSFALPGDRDTKNFFESHAMKSRLLIVHGSLDDGEGDDGG